MRALAGPLNRRDHRALVAGLDRAEVRCFDRCGADLCFDPAREPLAALWARLPGGWEPDCLVWWSPEYALLPEGIADCPVPSIAVLGDWNLGVWGTAPLLEAFDWVVTDRLGVRVLGPQLGVPVDRWPAFSFDPELHRPRPGAARDIDLLFVGNVNPEVQVDRAPWLGRLARLAGRHRVLLASGVYGQAYADLLARSRIVWNRSIRGELNMRAYEAPAAGALLLLEAENLEVAEVFADGVSCALYGPADLEAVVERYLSQPERLARVAEAGRRRVQSETYAHHVAALLDQARPLRPGPRPFRDLPAWRQDCWLGLHALASPDPAGARAALGHLGRAVRRGGDPATVGAAVAAAAVAIAAGATAPEQRGWLALAARLLDAVLAQRPGDPLTRANLAWVSAVRGDRDRARTEWLAARRALREGALPAVDRIPIPFAFDRFRVEWEQAALAPDAAERAAGFAPLLLARSAVELARLDGPEREVDWLTESVEARPGIAGNVRRLAGALERAGDPAGALLGYQRTLEAHPFDWEARAAAVALARQVGDGPALGRLVEDGCLLALAAPGCRPAMQVIETLQGGAFPPPGEAVLAGAPSEEQA